MVLGMGKDGDVVAKFKSKRRVGLFVFCCLFWFKSCALNCNCHSVEVASQQPWRKSF